MDIKFNGKIIHVREGITWGEMKKLPEEDDSIQVTNAKIEEFLKLVCLDEMDFDSASIADVYGLYSDILRSNTLTQDEAKNSDGRQSLPPTGSWTRGRSAKKKA